MADKKISQLTGATTPLAGTEVLPIVQSGSTVKVSVENVLKSTQPSGTANGVLYLNGSKIQSSGATFQFDGTNVGLASTPSAWAAFSAYQVGNGAMASLSSGNNSEWASNTYFSASGWKYTASSTATHYQQFNGRHIWFTAPSGTANAAATFTQVGEFDANGNLIVNTNNVVVGTAGKGIDFSANGGDLLSQYDEGTWAPADTSGAGLTFTVNFARFTRVGNLVTANCYLTYPSTGSTATAKVSLPFTAANFVVGSAGSDSTANAVNILANGGAADFTVRNNQLGTLTNADLSNRTLVFSITFQV